MRYSSLDENAPQNTESVVAIQDDGTIFADANDLDTPLITLQNLPDTNASIQPMHADHEPLFVGIP